MTYKESLKQAFLKTDSEESDYESDIFPILANEAQMFIAMYGTHITKMAEIEVTAAPKTVKLPEDFYRISPKGLVYSEDEKVCADMYMSDDGNMVINETGNFVLYYYALPTDISKEGMDLSDYEYEVDKSTHVAIPSFIGYQLVRTDDVQLAQILLNEWNKYMSLFTDREKATYKKIRNSARWW